MIDSDEIQRIAGNAHKAIEMFATIENKELDYDHASIRIVDTFINQNVGVFREPNSSQLVSILGAFLGECFVRNQDGEWDIEKGELCVRFKTNSVVFPFTKVRKQLENGAEDSVLSFFEVFPLADQKLKSN